MNNPPRVLGIVHSFGLGGSELFGVELGRRLVEKGVHVLCGALIGDPGPLVARCADYGIEVIDLKVPWRHPLSRNGISPGLASRLRALRLDAIHLQHFLALNKLGLPARVAGIPRVVLTEHSVHDVDQSRAGRFRARLNWRLATSITVIHQGIKTYLCQNLGIEPRRIEVIPVGIELERFHRRDRNEVAGLSELAQRSCSSLSAAWRAGRTAQRSSCIIRRLCHADQLRCDSFW